MKLIGLTICLVGASIQLHGQGKQAEAQALKPCADAVRQGIRKIAPTRDVRFEGKVSEDNALCRGGETSLPTGFLSAELPANRGVAGALIDLEFQRVEIIKFNLFEDSGTYKQYVEGRDGVGGPALKTWPEMRPTAASPFYKDVGGDGTQVCKGDLIRWRTVSGICNDILNPAMGSAGMLFARNVEFETTLPDRGLDELTRNRHGNRLSLLEPDPQVTSRRLFTREQSNPDACQAGYGLSNGSADANCDYKPAPFLNVLAAYWIQFMTHDWFSHLVEGHNQAEYMKVGCQTKLVEGLEQPLTPEEIARLGCRPDDRIGKGYVAQSSPPQTFSADGRTHMERSPQTEANTSTAWWDGSQLYGFDDRSRQRVKRDPADRAKLLIEAATAQPGPGYFPVFVPDDPTNPEWAGQEAAGFPDNWTVGLSFLHNLFAREHNSFVAEFRRVALQKPTKDSGLRDPADPQYMIRCQDVTDDILFEIARLVVTAKIAKIHTTEWTLQLLYNESLNVGMNGNWSGLLGADGGLLSKALSNIVVNNLGKSQDVVKSTQWYSVFASGPGIFGLGSKVSGYDITDPKYTNGGVNHFGSPFNFPEEFVSVYRLHPLMPDLLKYRDLSKDPNVITKKIAIVDTFQGKATPYMHTLGMANWGVTLGRQRLGLLELHNAPAFLQNLKISRLESPTQQIDVAALDIIRDRENGVPRFNEFRRRYGLRQFTAYDDFMNRPPTPEQTEIVNTLREVYGQHVCDASKVITDAQVDAGKLPINDCLGHADGSVVDNIEDVDTAVGYLAESVRPHGFAISETQFVVFLLNASRRLFSDRFFTSCFRPEFYTPLGVEWVTNNGPGPAQMEKGTPNGHKQPVSPLKRVLLRNIPELAPELANVVNAFDPWARDRGDYYSLQWKPRPEAKSDAHFKTNRSRYVCQQHNPNFHRRPRLILTFSSTPSTRRLTLLTSSCPFRTPPCHRAINL